MTKLQRIEGGLAIAMPLSATLVPIRVLLEFDVSVGRLVSSPHIYVPLLLYFSFGILAFLASITKSRDLTILILIPLIPILAYQLTFALMIGAYSGFSWGIFVVLPGLIYLFEGIILFGTQILRWNAKSPTCP